MSIWIILGTLASMVLVLAALIPPVKDHQATRARTRNLDLLQKAMTKQVRNARAMYCYEHHCTSGLCHSLHVDEA